MGSRHTHLPPLGAVAPGERRDTRRDRAPAALLALLLLLLPWPAACRPGGDGESLREAAGFPPEPGPGSFPGITYPRSEGPLPRPGSLLGPVWLIGVDGATWDLIEPMVKDGGLPVFREMMETGATAVLRSEEPTISPALWATIATGVPRFRHGITNFRVKIPGSYRLVQSGPPDRREPALWNLVGAAGGTSAVISWFGSFPAEEIAGFYVSKGFDPESPKDGQVHPPGLAEILARQARVIMRRGDLEEIGWNEDYRRTLVEDARALAALREVLRQDHPDFVAVYFAGVDVVQHVAWHHMDPASQAFPEDGEADPDLAGVIPAYYRYIDDTLGRIRSMAPEGTTIVVVSDHGAGPMRRDEAFVPALPPLLEALGLMDGEHGAVFTMSQPYRHEKPIWLNIRGVEPAGVLPSADAEAAAASIGERLLSLRTDAGKPVFSSVRNLAGEPGWAPGDPALSVRFSFAATASRTVTDGKRTVPAAAFVSRLPGVSGSHRPEGILLLSGPGIRPGRLAGGASIYNVAPTILYLLGLPQSESMLAVAPADGGVLARAIDPALLERAPIEMTDRYPVASRPGRTHGALPTDAEVGLDPAHEREMERLRSLGYIR